MTESENIDEKLLQSGIDGVDEILSNGASMEEKIEAILRTQKMILQYILSDHPRTMTMWMTFRPMQRIFLVAVAALVGIAVAGLAGHIQVSWMP